MPKILVIIPTYNESENILKLIPEILKFSDRENSFDILVIDDNSPDGTKIVPCGRFNFRFSDTTKPQIASFENLSTPATVYYLGQLKFHENGKSVTQKNVVLQKNDDFKTLDDSYSLDSVGEYYLSYPGDNHFYRVVFLGRKMTLSENSYSIICEKF